MPKHINTTGRARSLRNAQTKTEALLWSVLRGKQVSNLKFRRQHPVGPFFADFACVKHKLIIEIDGGYHDFVSGSDQRREQYLANEGWSVVRFTDTEIENDPEAIAYRVTEILGIAYRFRKRKASGAGMESLRAPGYRE